MCDLDGVFHALADAKRRHVIDCLRRHDAVSLSDLAEFVAEREREDDADAVPAERVHEVYCSLYHNHIPALEAADLADYEREADSVASTRHTQSSLARARGHVDSLLRES
ncbi:DUF7344 domain-containing protein [Halobacterium yunchengense]|uniref:DUF7344 domain-containing protein n=1 Tax=Halobacterium yunchengense TaxID=3108497 RepID=UPI00300B6F24